MSRKPIKAAKKGQADSSLGANRFTLPTYDSIAQCSASTGIPVAVLRFAKKNGCSAFDYSRVKLGAFLEWYFAQSDANHNWDDRYKEYRAKREQQKFAREDGSTIGTADAERAGAIMLGFLGKTLRQKFCNDMPSSLSGKQEPEIRIALGAALDDSFAQAKSKHQEAIESAKKNEDDELAS